MSKRILKCICGHEFQIPNSYDGPNIKCKKAGCENWVSVSQSSAQCEKLVISGVGSANGTVMVVLSNGNTRIWLPESHKFTDGPNVFDE